MMGIFVAYLIGNVIINSVILIALYRHNGNSNLKNAFFILTFWPIGIFYLLIIIIKKNIKRKRGRKKDDKQSNR